jgi:hypothetical protein
MWALLVSLSAAHAGPAVGVMVGGALPLATDTLSDPGAQLGLYAGYRKSIGPVHLQPELVFRTNTGAAPLEGTEGGSQLSALAGGAVTFLGPVSFGPYAHVGLAVQDIGPVYDAGLMAEFTAVGPLAVGLRLGWQDERVGECPVCELEPAKNWLVGTVTAGLAF